MGANLAYLTDKYDVHTGNLTDQLVTRAVATPASVDEQAYSYDPAGNITAQASTRLGSPASSETQCFTYDQLDRLSMAWTATDSCAATPSSSNSATVGDSLGASSAYWTSWSYDALGNRTSQVQHSVTGGADTTTAYSYDGNGTSQPGTLTSTSTTGGSAGSTSYRYDATGNMTTRTAGQGSQSLSWDDAGQLTAITGGTGGDSHYVYDASGNVLLQKDPGATTLYLPGEQITLDTTTQATTGIRYYPMPGGGIAYRTGTGTSYGFEITDQHGTPVLTLDNTAQIPTWRQFTPYGAPRGTAVTWADNRGFLDKPTDPSTGLTIIGARQYDPTAGRFISLDPLLDATSPQELGGYTYAADNPITNSDPSGLHNVPPPDQSGCPSSEPGCAGYHGPGGQDRPVPSPGVGGGGGSYNSYTCGRFGIGCGSYSPGPSKPARPSDNFPYGYHYNFDERILPIAETGSPASVMRDFQENPRAVFPFPITGCRSFTPGTVCTLHAAPAIATGVGQVRVTTTRSSFTFTVISNDYFDAPGSQITFSLSQNHGYLHLSQRGAGYNSSIFGLTGVYSGFAEFTWYRQAANLRTLLAENYYSESYLGQPPVWP